MSFSLRGYIVPGSESWSGGKRAFRPIISLIFPATTFHYHSLFFFKKFSIFHKIETVNNFCQEHLIGAASAWAKEDSD